MRELPPLPGTDLLIAGRVIPIMPRLVQIVGLNEAIVLQQLRYLLDDERRPLVRDGRRWVAGSYAEWQTRHFPFWRPDTVERAFRSLERQGAIAAAAHNASRRDHTKWYSVEFDRLIEWERICRASLSVVPLPGDPFRPTNPGRATGASVRVAAAPLPSTDLLLDEHPLLLLPGLASLIGFDEAIVLQQVRYWLADSRRPLVHEGCRWARFNQEGWHAQLAFRSRATVARAFRRLEELGLLRSSSRFNEEPGDRTKAYTIDFARLAALRDAAATPAPDDHAGASAAARHDPGSGPELIPATDLPAPLRGAPGGQGPAGALSQIAANHDSKLRRPTPQFAAARILTPPIPQTQNAANHERNLLRPSAQPAATDGRNLPHSSRDTDSVKIVSENEIQQQ